MIFTFTFIKNARCCYDDGGSYVQKRKTLAARPQEKSKKSRDERRKIRNWPLVQSNVITDYGSTLVNGCRFTAMGLMVLDKNYFP